MARYAVLLRGINVGGMTLSMADLRSIAESAGCASPATILNTGNLLVQTDDPPQKLKDRLERALSQRMEKPMHCLVRDLDQLESLTLEAEPPAPGMHHYILFCERPLYDELQERYRQYAHAQGEALYASGQDIHWLVRKGGTLADFGSKVLGSGGYKPLLTSRNLSTVRKIVEKLRAM